MFKNELLKDQEIIINDKDPHTIAAILEENRFVEEFRMWSRGVIQFEMFKGWSKHTKRENWK